MYKNLVGLHLSYYVLILALLTETKITTTATDMTITFWCEQYVNQIYNKLVHVCVSNETIPTIILPLLLSNMMLPITNL